MAERQFGPYRLVRQIAVGGMAEIHLAKTKGIAGFEKYVALKMIHPNFAEDEAFIQMLVDEAKIAVQLNHGNIAQTFDLGRVGDTFYITMEYVDGADLYKILRRASEIDLEMPLDVCAFVAKEVASALDHAHRKRDHAGKTLGIVHRDVSPQNVLLSYAGEVKLVDFGIAKATMKVRQTAVGVIKGKYYYMSPEQAWGDQIDYRSDIFSAGIVLYEMITGQMLYLEEDLHKLLDMARKAAIAPPSTLRKGVPPQLERIVMHALERDRRNRYQSASDFAADLERFLHAYSPVFTAAKIAQLIKHVIGDPLSVGDQDVEVREGPASTHTLTADDLILDKDELNDENSVIFRVADLKPKQESERKRAPGSPEGRVTRQADINDLDPPTNIPSPPRKAATPSGGNAAAARQAQRTPAKPRMANEETRQVANPAPPSGRSDDSGLLDVQTPQPGTADAWKKQTDLDPTYPGEPPTDTDLQNVADSTMITGAPNAYGGYLMDVASDEGVEATVVSIGPPVMTPTSITPVDPPSVTPTPVTTVRLDDDELDGETVARQDGDGPTMQRDFRDASKPRGVAPRAAAPAALAAKIHAPAVSEIRKPRASRKTPGAGVPTPNVLQAIVGAQPAEPMPAPRPGAPPVTSTPATGTQRNEDSGAMTIPQQPSPVAGRALAGAPGSLPLPPGPGQLPPMQGMPSPHTHGAQHPMQPGMQPPSLSAYTGYATDASGLPVTPPQGLPQQGYPQPQGYPQQGYVQYPGYPQQPGFPPPPMTPGALYQLQPHGMPRPKEMSLTGQMRLYEADELADKYKVTGGPKWIKLMIAGIVAISLAAGVTFFIIKATRDKPPAVGTIRVESIPAGAEVIYDDERLAGSTPLEIPSVPVGTRHEIKVELKRHKPYVETVDVPRSGGQLQITAKLEPIKGKIRIITTPENADIVIDGKIIGRTPMTVPDLEIGGPKVIELRLKDHHTHTQNLVWPDNGQIDINQKLVPSN